jgi:hypothetical protein
MKFGLIIGLMFVSLLILGCSSDSTYTACTEEAKTCPDGSAVGRTGPDCEFAECPSSVECSDESRLADLCTQEYDPVCGWFSEEIKCIKYPCASTFSNGCGACKDTNVAYYTKGECPI